MTPPTVLLRVTPEAIETLFTRDHDGNRLRVEWGEAGADGFHDPVISVDYTDNIHAADKATIATLNGIIDLNNADIRDRDESLVMVRAAVVRQREEIATLRAENERTREWIDQNLAVWSDDEDTSQISMAVCDLLRKVRNVMDTGHPLAAKEAESA